jgi:integral membrane sensor domain MASE1
MRCARFARALAAQHNADVTTEDDTATTGRLRYAGEAAAFAACYILLDWASFIDPLGRFNITAWNPQPALAIVWMTRAGISQWPVVFLTLVVADVLVRDAPGGYAATAGSSFVLAAGYATIALVLSRGLRHRDLQSTRDLVLFALTVVVGAAIVGGSYVNVLSVAGLLPGISITDAWLRFWLGDAVGILVTGPLLFALADAAQRRRLAARLRDLEPWVWWSTLCALLWFVLRGAPHDVAPHLYVLLFVPVLCVALRWGMSGAVIAMVIVQLGVILGVHGDAGRQLSIVELQLLVCILCVTGLLIAVVVEERRRTRTA